MRIVDRSPYPSASGWMSIRNKLLGTLQFGLGWYQERSAQDVALGIISHVLDDRYTLIREMRIPNSDIPISTFLIGPPGALMMYMTPVKGIFRAKVNEWLVTSGGGAYSPAEPNMVEITSDMTLAIQDHLDRLGYSRIKIEPVLMCTDPGTHVELSHPLVRVVLSDAIQRFIVSFKQNQPTLNTEEIETVVQKLTKGKIASPGMEVIEEKAPETFVGRMLADVSPQQRLILLALAVFSFVFLIVLAFIMLGSYS